MLKVIWTETPNARPESFLFSTELAARKFVAYLVAQVYDLRVIRLPA